MQLNLNFNAATYLHDWWQTVKSNFTTVQTDFNGEVTARQNADSALDGKIGSLDNLTTAVKTSLVAAINSEKSARESADSIIDADVSKLKDVVDKKYLLNPDLLEDTDTYVSDVIPLNKLFVLTNNTGDEFDGFADLSGQGTKLSEAIPNGESRVCVKVSAGTDSVKGYIFVLNDKGIRDTISTLGLLIQQTGQGVSGLRTDLNTEISNRGTADNILKLTKENCFDFGTYNVSTGDVENEFISNTTGIPYVGDFVKFTVNADCNSVSLPFSLYSPSVFPEVDITYGFISGHTYIAAVTENYNIESSPIPTVTSNSKAKVIYDNGVLVDAAVGTLSSLTTTDKTSLVAAVNEVNGKIPSNVRYVACTGTNDQTAIQAALDAVGTLGGGTVYVCGSCGLSDTGVTQTSNLGGTYSNWTAILNIPSKVTLDFSNCPLVSWGVSAGTATKQMVFSVKAYGRVQNMRFEDNDSTETGATIADAIIVSGNACVVDNVKLSTLVVNRNITDYKFIFGNNVVLSNVMFESVTDTTSGSKFIKAGTDFVMSHCIIGSYDDSEAATPTESILINAGAQSSITNCKISGVSGSISVKIQAGNNSQINNNIIYQPKGLYFQLFTRSEFADNNIYNPRIYDYQMFVKCAANCTVADNVISNAFVQEECYIVDATEVRGLVTGNQISINKFDVAAASTDHAVIIAVGDGKASDNIITLPTSRTSAPNFTCKVFESSNVNAMITDNKIINLGANDTDFDTTSGGIVHCNVVDGVYTA